MMIRLVQIGLLLLVTLSVALLPVAPLHAARAKTNDPMAFSVTPDCSDHHSRPTSDTFGNGISGMATAQCGVACSASFTTPASAVALSLAVVAASAPVLADSGVVSKIGSPPFRPPRF